MRTWICMYVCMYLWMYIYIYIYIHTYVHTCICTGACTCVYACIRWLNVLRVCALTFEVRLCACTYTCTYTIFVCLQNYMHACIYARPFTSTESCSVHAHYSCSVMAGAHATAVASCHRGGQERFHLLRVKKWLKRVHEYTYTYTCSHGVLQG